MEKETASISKKVEDFLQVFKKGEEFTQELLKENEKLRYKVAKLEEVSKFFFLIDSVIFKLGKRVGTFHEFCGR